MEGKKPREHQLNAITKAHIHYMADGNDRGKLIMACGTGKTYTSLLIAEQLFGNNGLVLFMVPSIALLGQSLNAWSADAKKPIKAVCICSDSKASRKTTKESDDTDDSVVDLAVPASTNPQSIASQLKKYRDHDGLVVVFSTYQSIDAISAAQQEILSETNGEYGVFDFIICDEAHRTTA
ncbi:DEAD/DEAH box helicase family protein [Phocaeicola dorei]|nr:DEAD/DEAH box helicase family protein [Phocaeicola dorei]